MGKWVNVAQPDVDPKLDLLKMLEEIDDLVNNDFMMKIEAIMCTDDPQYTQDEAAGMAQILTDVYRISHATHCKACHTRFLKPITE